MNNLLKCELYKLRHSKGFVVMMIISALCGVIGSIFFAYAEFLGSGINLTGYEAYYSMFTDLRTFMLIFAGVFSGIFIGEDYFCRAYQAELALGNSRFKVLLNKTIVYMIGIMFMIFTWQIVTITLVSLINGFGEILTIGLIGNMLRASLMFSLHICAISMLCVATSVAIKNKGTIILVNFLLLVIIDGIFQGVSLLHDIGIEIYSRTPLIHAIIFASPKVPMSDLIYSILTGIITMILLFSLSLSIFRKSELK